MCPAAGGMNPHMYTTSIVLSEVAGLLQRMPILLRLLQVAEKLHDLRAQCKRQGRAAKQAKRQATGFRWLRGAGGRGRTGATGRTFGVDKLLGLSLSGCLWAFGSAARPWRKECQSAPEP